MNQLIEYIKNVKKQGYSDAAIKQNLLQSGYTQSQIDAAFNELHPQGHMVILFLLVGALIVIGGVFLVWKWFLTPDMCEGVKLSLYERPNIPDVCIYPDYSKLQLTLENTGNQTITAIEVADQRIAVEIPPDEVRTKVIDLDGQPRDQVTITPYASKACTEKQLVISSLKTC